MKLENIMLILKTYKTILHIADDFMYLFLCVSLQIIKIGLKEITLLPKWERGE